MNKDQRKYSDKGFSLIEVIIAGALLTAITIMSMSFLKSQNTVTEKIDRKNEFNEFLYIFQKRLNRIEKENTPDEIHICKEVFGNTSFNQAVIDGINNENSLDINLQHVMSSIGGFQEKSGEYYFSGYKINKVSIFGDDSGLKELSSQGNFKTYEAIVSIELKKATEAYFIPPFEIIISIDTNLGLLESCHPLLFSASQQGFSSNICRRMLGEDFEVDSTTGECLVPVYTNCAANDDGCKSKFRSATTKVDPIQGAGMNIKDVLCNLVVRGSVSGKLYCK